MIEIIILSFLLLATNIFFIRRYGLLYRKAEMLWSELHILKALQEEPRRKNPIVIPKFDPNKELPIYEVPERKE